MSQQDPQIRVLAIVGSLRKGSYNMALARAAAELAPAGMKVEIFDRLGEIPPYNEDAEDTLHDSVKDLKARVRAADALLFATPEYNYSVPGVLKNAIDWASRPARDNSFEDKPVAVMSAGASLGGARAQIHLRQVFVFLNMHPVNRPQVQVIFARSKVDEKGEFSDPTIRESVKQLMANLDAWTRRLRKA